ncbi:MAG: tyrosine-type recombinase/integrase, partial [Pseudomonadota bacterium]
MRKLTMALAMAALLPALAPQTAHAWWNPDWTQRTRVTLNTTAQGVETKEVVNATALPVRLHSGNFDFLSAKPDGSDLRSLRDRAVLELFFSTGLRVSELCNLDTDDIDMSRDEF